MNAVSYKPSVWYFRRALRQARDTRTAVEIGLQLCRELEQLKEWVREQGLIPPRQHITTAEIADKPRLLTGRLHVLQ